MKYKTYSDLAEYGFMIKVIYFYPLYWFFGEIFIGLLQIDDGATTGCDQYKTTTNLVVRKQLLYTALATAKPVLRSLFVLLTNKWHL